MEIISTGFEGLYILKPQVFKDNRGIFFESYSERKLEGYLPKGTIFVQDNHSVSKKMVLRGMHLQKEPYAQIKIVRVIKGQALDVVVDARKDSSTFGKYFKTILTSEGKEQLLVPKGFAHGFLALTDNVEFVYKSSNFYHPESESGIAYNDPEINIDWGVPDAELILSDKDKNLNLTSIHDLNFYV